MKNFEKEEVLEVINEIYEEFVDDIIKKVCIPCSGTPSLWAIFSVNSSSMLQGM